MEVVLMRQPICAVQRGAVLSVPDATLRRMNTSTTKKCMHCQGPIGSTVKSTAEGWGVGEPVRTDTFYHCRNQCQLSRLTGECGH